MKFNARTMQGMALAAFMSVTAACSPSRDDGPSQDSLQIEILPEQPRTKTFEEVAAPIIADGKITAAELPEFLKAYLRESPQPQPDLENSVAYFPLLMGDKKIEFNGPLSQWREIVMPQIEKELILVDSFYALEKSLKTDYPRKADHWSFIGKNGSLASAFSGTAEQVADKIFSQRGSLRSSYGESLGLDMKQNRAGVIAQIEAIQEQLRVLQADNIVTAQEFIDFMTLQNPNRAAPSASAQAAARLTLGRIGLPPTDSNIAFVARQAESHAAQVIEMNKNYKSVPNLRGPQPLPEIPSTPAPPPEEPYYDPGEPRLPKIAPIYVA